jgi:hypothetical protein
MLHMFMPSTLAATHNKCNDAVWARALLTFNYGNAERRCQISGTEVIEFFA